MTLLLFLNFAQKTVRMASILPLLAGNWFIVGSNFPMWLKGNRTDPSFQYTVSEYKGLPVLLDKVRFIKDSEVKIIEGIDQPDPKHPGRFTWRGKGLLSLLKSRWEVRLIDENNQWAVIWFSKTLFTPEGVDIIFREMHADDAVLEEIKSKMTQDSMLQPHVETLKRV